jgi:4-amino-4-deoxy-L-arabinose transferase-like glycosyltransferase
VHRDGRWLDTILGHLRNARTRQKGDLILSDGGRPLRIFLATPISEAFESRDAFQDNVRAAALFVLFAAVWAVYFAISESPAVIPQSMAEAYAWGQEFQLGYNQHPPFWAWICGAWFLVFPHTNWAFGLLSALNCTIGLWGAWRLIGRLAGGATRNAATALLLATPFYTLLGYGFNANIIFVSVWPWTLYFFVRSIESPRKLDAVWLGVMLAAALLSKYYALILWATCFLAALRHPACKAYFGSIRPYLSLAVALALFAPHVAWLIANGAPPLRYFGHVSHLGYAAALHNALSTLLGALAENALAIALIVYAAKLSPREAFSIARSRVADPRLQVIAILALAPLVLSLAACLAFQSKLVTPMLQGTFSLVPLLVIEMLGRRRVDRLDKLATRVAVVAMIAAAPLAAVGGAYWVWLSNNPKVTDPRAEIAATATKLWRDKTGLPLTYVGGSYGYGDAVAFYSPDHPHSFESLDYSRRLWVTPERLATSGLMTLCAASDTDCLNATARYVTPESSHSEISLAHTAWGRTFAPVSVVMTIIPPR